MAWKVKDKIKTVSIGFRPDQIKWINKNKTFKVHKYMRDKLDEYILMKKNLLELI